VALSIARSRSAAQASVYGESARSISVSTMSKLA